MRGRVISRNELLFQLANVTGAALRRAGLSRARGSGSPLSPLCLILGGVTYASELRLSLRHEAGRWLLGQRPLPRTEGLPLALLAEAMRFAEQGDHYVAVVVADSAVRVVDARSRADAGDRRRRAAWDALAGDVAAVVAGTHGSDVRQLDGGDQSGRRVDRRTLAAEVAERSTCRPASRQARLSAAVRSATCR